MTGLTQNHEFLNIYVFNVLKFKLFRPPSPLSIDSFSGIYIGPEEKRKTIPCDIEGKDKDREEEKVPLSFSVTLMGTETKGEKKKKRRGLFFLNTYSSKAGSDQQTNMDRSENLCFQLFKRSFNSCPETG